MTIRIVRNEEGNCINFVGSTQPAYWNACLTAEASSENATQINIRNNNRSLDVAEPVYEFFRIEYTDFQDVDGNALPTVSLLSITLTKANVTGLGSTDEVGSDLTGLGAFSLDDTSTSILLSIGYSYGVDTIKAVPTRMGLSIS